MAVFNKKQAAQYCGISVETLDKYKDMGKLSYIKIGDRCLFKQAHLDEFLDRSTILATVNMTPREALEVLKKSNTNALSEESVV